MVSLGNALAWVEHKAATLVEKNAEKNDGFIRRRFPGFVSAVEDSFGKRTEEVLGADGTVDHDRTINLSLTSTAAVVAALLMPGPLAAVPALAAVGFGWAAVLGAASSSIPYLVAAGAQGALAARTSDSGLRKAALATSRKNLLLAGLNAVPIVGVIGNIIAATAQVRHRDHVRTQQQAMLAGVNAALESVPFDVQEDAPSNDVEASEKPKEDPYSKPPRGISSTSRVWL